MDRYLKGFFVNLVYLEETIKNIGNILWWPWLVILFFIVGILMTIFFDFVQVRYFADSWKYIFQRQSTKDGQNETISPLQALLGAISAMLGNGSLAGMATAVSQGGPGAALWVFVIGFFTMPIRLAEVVASSTITVETPRGLRGGPMVYLGKVPGGSILPYLYAFFCLLICFVSGVGMQGNSITVGMRELSPLISHWIIAVALILLILYIALGGAQRIITFAEMMAPVKVILFLLATAAVLIYCAPQLGAAFMLIFKSAFTLKAAVGGLAGYTMQTAIRFGMSRSLNASEAGLGTAGIFFGATGGANPVRSGIMAMASNFLAMNIICFLMLLVLIVSGVWDSGLASTAMVGAAYATVFGFFGKVIAALLTVLFGVGVMVGYLFIGRECWLFLTGGRMEFIFYLIFSAMALVGVYGSVGLIWNSVDAVNAGIIFCNLYGLLILIPVVRKALRAYRAS